MATEANQTLVRTVRASTTNAAASSQGQLQWLDIVKALALIWIVTNHLAEVIFGIPAAGNPDGAWPPLAARLHQFSPIGHGVTSVLPNVFRYIGWTGDQGVTVFLIASGFGMTYGLLRRSAPTRLAALPFYRVRGARIYPLWWAAHWGFGIAGIALGGISFGDPQFYLSLLGIRFTPETMYYFSPPWWYIGLLLQLYLVFPLLWRGLQSFGVRRFFISCAVVGLGVRAIGLFTLHGYLDEWSRGTLFITRLPEFALGMALATWYYSDPIIADRRLRASATVVASLVVLGFGFALSFSLAGMTVAPLLMGGTAFTLFYALIPLRTSIRGLGWLRWTGVHSYSIFIVHQPFIAVFFASGFRHTVLRIVAGALLTIVGTVLAALLLERTVGIVLSGLSRVYGHWRLRGVVAAMAAFGLIGAGMLLAANAVVAREDPQEVYGWGERPSLEPDAVVGWKLIPNRTTQLRWITYDYRVTANGLGFPGPGVALAKPAGAFRIMTTGDAFTSAEGVDTDRAWPRLLERDLRARDTERTTQVMNFAITGYGPNQYAATVRTYAPHIKPDIILMEIFTNDYEDILTSDDDFRRSIGFGQPNPYGLRSTVGLQQLSQFVRNKFSRRLQAGFSGQPTAEASLFSDAPAFDPKRPGLAESRRLMRARLEEIRAVAKRVHARIILAMFPSSLQICRRADLAYATNNLALADPELPQRMTRSIADSLGLTYVDLRPVLRAPGPCPYQRNNFHFTQRGHELVASYFSKLLGTLR